MSSNKIQNKICKHLGPDRIKNDLAARGSGFLIDQMEIWCHVCTSDSFLEKNLVLKDMVEI